MKRKDLRTNESEWRRTCLWITKPKQAKRQLKAYTVIKVMVVAILLVALYQTAPQRMFEECQGTDVPRYCME